ncbi:hypothetical protein GOQ29_02635 [Clostridium sp. D2Q-14]|uniref:hypothetical protein n=1 Tax=Anaeromonas gelatinilytica TaxID=2683194 RepID=UPI00193C67B4|nr:hypothetical protein [Anaeromonas gelatinilytica]MBS4534506.1 hypothetical protein [Anaeromonas gelatinilytica]
MVKDVNHTKFIIFSIIILLFFISITMTSEAAYSIRVRKQWDKVTQDVGTINYLVYDTNISYINLTVVNGYTYSTSTKDITSASDRLLKIISRVRYTRTYKVY